MTIQRLRKSKHQPVSDLAKVQTRKSASEGQVEEKLKKKKNLNVFLLHQSLLEIACRCVSLGISSRNVQGCGGSSGIASDQSERFGV